MSAPVDNRDDVSGEDGAPKTEAKNEEDFLKEEIRRFTIGVTDSSLRNQRIVFSSLIKAVERTTDLPEAYIKGLVKISTVAAFRRYCEPESFQLVSRLLDALAKHDPCGTLRHLAQSVLALYPCLPALSEHQSRSAVHPSKWLLKLISESVPHDTNVIAFSAIASLSYYCVVCPKSEKVFGKKLSHALAKFPQDVLFQALSELAKDTQSGAKLLTLLSFVDKVSELHLSDMFIEVYSKTCLVAKSAPPTFVMECCAGCLFKLNSEKFATALLPNVKKALLRSPEVAMYGVRCAFKSLNFPLDPFADDVMKSVSASLNAMDENLRTEAVSVVTALAVRSEPATTGKAVDKLFDYLTSAKSAEQRITLLEGIANCSKTSVASSPDLDKIGNRVISKTAKADKDTHEGTVSAQWDAAVAWAGRLSCTSPELVNMFKESTKMAPSLRSIGYRSLAKIATTRQMTSLPEGSETVLWAQLDASNKDALDAIGLCTVLLKTAVPGSEQQKKAWLKITANEHLFKEKSLGAITWKDAVVCAELIERVVLDRPFVEGTHDYPSMALQSLSLLLFWPHWEVRRRAMQAVERIIVVENAPFAEALADIVYVETVNGTISENLRKVPQSSVQHDIPGEWYVLLLRNLLKLEGTELDKLAIHTLLLASLPKLVEVDGAVWLRWVHESGRNWENSQTFQELAIERVLGCKERDVRNTALITLVALNIPDLKKALWLHLEEKLSDLTIKAYGQLSEKEVAIWKCPEGQLYNTDVLNFDEGEYSSNMKRENKAYSYKEQLQEMQLRRELAEKKRKEGKLTVKQKQVMEKELQNEQLIRVELQGLYEVAESSLNLASAMVVADPPGAFARSEILFDYCLPLTRSYLVAEEAANLFLAYRDAAFPHSEDYLGELLGSCWLRVIGCRWQDSNWVGEPLNDALRRTLSLLNERAFVVDTGDEDGQDDMMIFDEIVGAPQLTVLYPLIKIILTGSYGDTLKDDTLNLLKSSMHKRFLKDGAVLQLPLLEYANLLLSYHADTLNSACLQAIINLVSLANESEDTGDRVVSMIGGALQYLKTSSPEVRENVLKVLSAPQLITRLVLSAKDEDFVLDCLVRLFVVRFDDVEAISQSATNLWYASLLHLRTTMGVRLVDECVSEVDFVRASASRALADYIEEFPGEIENILIKIDDVYRDLSTIRGAVFDEVGRMQRDAVDEWERRSGVGVCLGQIASLIDSKFAVQLIKIVVPLGLQDRQPVCRNSMTAAAVETIRRHGSAIMPTMLPFLEKLSDNTPAGAEHDSMRQGLVVLLGTLAQFLEPSSEKVKAIVSRLLEILNTPSQTVQESVSRCLPPLVPAVRSECRTLVGRLQYLLFNADSYGERRGAAYGLAGIVKGMGMIAFKELDLLPTIKTSLADKKNWKLREGALLALEILCSTIGKLFEPYMIQTLPSLLLCFGDNDSNVRKAAEDTAKSMMSSMSAHGTKLVLPSLITALDDDSWRTKCAATELLGSMAFCAPKQLSACLPSIVPKLIEVLADSSSKVQKSGEKALNQIARVVRNPEIIGVTNQLMTGLLDPANKTSMALQAVLNTKFVHYIDAPSLALLMPIVRRAFEDRNSETRRVAAQIIASIYNLTEHKDMEPYLSDLVPGLQKSLLDPVPEIRTVAARALGAIVSKSSGATSERLRDEIVPWLKDRLVSAQSTVDRSGAAQGLCEVLAGVGTEQLDYVMPEIIAATESTEVSAEMRDGYILMYIYLPMVFGERFLPYLPRVVPPILKALADENEYVRASALKAGQRLIAQYCSHARRLLLPQLQVALMDDNWRIRYAAVQLIGDFLFNISGVTGKSSSSTANEDDTMGMEQAGKTIVRALGQQCRDRILAGIYLARSDVALTVRQAAGHVWKIVVSNTPRTLKEVMKTLFEMIVGSLASACEERQQMGARCLGELVRKMGDKIINEILPVLEVNGQSEEVEKRVGVAVALHEIIDNMSKDVLNHYLASLVPPVRRAICDDEATVRSAAADTFSVLYNNVGHDALDEIITPLLEKLTPEQDHILEGLCEVMRLNSRQMLPYLLPRLTKPPINVHALCSLAAVAGDSLSRQLPRVLDALLASCETNDQYDPMIDPCEKVVIAVTDEDGVPVLAEYLLKRASGGNVPAAVLLHTFIAKSGVALNDLSELFLTGLLQLYTSANEQIVDHAVQSAIGVAQPLDQQELQDLLPIMKKTLNIMVSQAKGNLIPGFAHPKGLQPLLPMLREGILQGGVELKALAGETLGMIVSISTPIALKAHVVNITGPLIRVLGDRYPPNVKLAILDTLSRLLDKVDAMLRPFLPQLQSTFLKALQEPSSRPVRLAAGGSLARLLRIHPKPEPLVTELFKLLANSKDQALLETTFVAARALVAGSAAKLSEATFDEGYRVCELVYSQSLSSASEMDRSLTMCSGALLGELAIRKGEPADRNILKDVEKCGQERVRQAKAIALQQMCHVDASLVYSKEYSSCRAALLSAFSGDAVTASAALRAAAFILMSEGVEADRELLSAVGRTVNHASLDVRKVTGIVLGHIAKGCNTAMPNDILKLIVPQLVNGTKESNSTVRCAAELALVHAFRFPDGEDSFNSYRGSVEGAAKTVLDEVAVTLRRVVRHGDIALEPLHDTLSV